MATTQPNTRLYIKHKVSIAGKHYYYVVGDPEMLRYYQSTLQKPFIDEATGCSMFCSVDPESILVKTGMLKIWKKPDGNIGWFTDLDEYKALRDLASKQPPALVEFFMRQAMAVTNTPIPEEYLEQLETPVQVAPPALPQVDPSDLDAVFGTRPDAG